MRYPREKVPVKHLKKPSTFENNAILKEVEGKTYKYFKKFLL